VLPGEPVPVRLMNTIWADRSGVHDALTTTGDLHAWLAATHPGLVQPEPGHDDLHRFRALRDAVRRLAALVTSDTRTATASATTSIGQAVAEVNRAAAQAPTWPQLVYQGGDLHAAAGGGAIPARRALSSIAHQAVALLLLLFPTGRLRSRRWRPAAWFVAAVFTLDAAAQVVRAGRVWADPFTALSAGWYPGSHTAVLIAACTPGGGGRRHLGRGGPVQPGAAAGAAAGGPAVQPGPV